MDIKIAKLEPVQDVINALEDALVEAKSGYIRSVVIVGDATGHMIYRRIGMEDRIMLIGHLAYATSCAIFAEHDDGIEVGDL